MTKCVLIVQLEIPQVPHNLFGPSAQIGQLFGIFKKKALITCPLSMAVGNQIVKSPLSETQRKWLDPIIVQRRIAEGLMNVPKGCFSKRNSWTLHKFDANYPPEGDINQPGVVRGPCPADSGKPSDVESQQADATVVFSNVG